MAQDWVLTIPRREVYEPRILAALSGTARGGTYNTITLAEAAAPSAQLYLAKLMSLLAGTASGQSRRVVAFDEVTKVATVSPAWSAEHLLLGAVGQNYARTPSLPAHDLTGDMSVRALVGMATWSPAEPADEIHPTPPSWNFSVMSYGILRFTWTATGEAPYNMAESTARATVVNGVALGLRADLDVDNGAGGHTVTFYTAADYNPATGAGTWVQLGDVITGSGTTSVFDTTAPVQVGSAADTLTTGEAVYAEARRGSTVVVKFDPSAGYQRALTLLNSTGLWTMSTEDSLAGAVPFTDTTYQATA